MKKENLLKGLQGTIAVGALLEEDSYVLALCSNTENLIIPLIRKGGIGSAYIDPDQFDDSQFEKLDTIIKWINTEKIFPIFKYTAKYKKAPEFNHTVVKFVKPSGMKQILPKGLEKALTAEGYTISEESGSAFPYSSRDYGSQVEDNPDFKMQFEAEKQKLIDAKANFETLSPEIKSQYKAVQAGAKDGIIFVGPTGTGKTWLTMALAVQAGAHREDIQITPDTQVEDLVGKYVADTRPDAKSNWRFAEGPLLKAYHLGYVISIQEINYGLAGVNSCLNRYLDGTLQVTENDTVYHRHPNFVAYLTMNAGYEGTEPLNMALKNRFTIVQVPALTEKEFVKRLINHSEYLGNKISEAFAKEIFKFANVIEQTAKGSNWHENVKFSIRNAQRFLNSILLEQKSFEDFCNDAHCEYTNLLSCDNDNSDKLENYKKEPEVVNMLKKMYDLYEFSEVEYAKKSEDNLDFLFEEESEEDSIDKETDDAIKDELFDRFGL